MNKRKLLSFLIGLTLGCTSCIPLIIGAAAGAGGVAYINGDLEKNFDRSVSAMHKSTLAALKDMDIFIDQDELNLHSALIKGEYESGQKIQIKIDALTEQSSKIKIRVDTFGDQEKSQMILNAIKKRF
jgi:hypothetical protein